MGPMIACASEEALYLLEYLDRRMLEAQLRAVSRRLDARFVPGSNPIPESVRTQLEEYFAGYRRSFDVPLETPGSELQRAVWDRLRAIGYGETATYGEIASQVGRGRAVRAIGRAVGDNPIAIVVPCHRVLGSGGSLTGYGGGLWRKQWLLDLELRASSLSAATRRDPRVKPAGREPEPPPEPPRR